MPSGIVDVNGEAVFLVGLIGSGSAVAVYALALGLADVALSWQRYTIDGGWCCRLKEAAHRQGVVLDHQAPDDRSWTWGMRYTYCRHCLDCNRIKVLNTTVKLTQSLVKTVPESMFTGPVVSDPLDLALTAVQQAAESVGRLIVGSVTVTSGEARYSYVDASTAPCDLSRCRGFMP